MPQICLTITTHLTNKQTLFSCTLLGHTFICYSSQELTIAEEVTPMYFSFDTVTMDISDKYLA